jgi:hypothetical protein
MRSKIQFQSILEIIMWVRLPKDFLDASQNFDGNHAVHGSVALDPLRLGRDAGRIAEEVVQHLTAIPGTTVEITLEVRADLPDGAPDKVVRDVTGIL